MKSKWLMLFPVALLLYSCAKHGWNVTEPVKYNIAYFDKKFGECDTNNFSNCVKLNFEYPEINYSEFLTLKDSAAKHIDNFLLSPVMGEKPASRFEEIADSMISDFKRVKRDFPDAPVGYTLERNVTVLFNASGILGLEMKEYVFMGGAHPNTMIYYQNFNCTDVSILKLSDLFIAGYEKTLNAAGEAEFRKARNLTENESLEKAGFWFKDDKFSINENFLIQRDGLKFLFNNYEEAPYAMGNTEFVIPFSVIKYIIRKDGPLAVLTEE